MNRRSFILSSTAAAPLILTSATAFAKSKKHSHGHKKDDRHDHGHDHADVFKLDPKKQNVVQKALECSRDASLCAAHCAAELAKGNTSLAECNRQVQDLEIMCSALAKITARDNMKSRAYKKFVQACMQVCESCAKVCKKHVDHHAQCKACYESCMACIKACKSVV